MIQNRITYHILSLLYLNGKVRIPGIGRIIHSPQNATVDDTTSTIVPPQSHNLFVNDRQGKNRLLERFLVYKTSMSRTRARREIARFSNGIRSGIRKDGKIELKYLGTFSSKDDELHFSPDEKMLNPGYSVFKPVSLPSRLPFTETTESIPFATVDSTRPVPDTLSEPAEINTEEVHEGSGQQAPSEYLPIDTEYELIPPPAPIVVEDTPKPVEIPLVTSEVAKPLTTPTAKVPVVPVNEKKLWPLVIPVAALVLLGLLVGAFLFYQSRIVHKEKAVVSATAPIDTSTPDKSVTDDLSPSKVVAGDGHTEIRGDTQEAKKIVLADTGTHNDHNVVDDHTSETSSATPEEEPSTQTPASVESVHAATGECLIVLGAFSQDANKERMMQRLQALGYTTVINPRDQLTRVAIPVDCKAKNLNLVLDFLRKNVEEKAWVMRPK